MKIEAPARPLAQTIKIVGRAAGVRSTMPILGGLLFEARDGVLSLSATDTEITVQLRAGAPISEEGSAVIGARLLSGILRSLPPNEAATLTADAGGASLRCAGGTYNMRVYPTEDFPKMAPFAEEGTFTLDIETLSEAVAKVLPAVSRDHQRPIITGVKTVFEEGRLTVAATDSYRLAVYTTEAQGGPKEKKEAVIPARALSEALKVCSEAQANTPGLKTVEVSITESAVHFRAGPVVLQSRLIAGNFPEYQRLMPDSFETAFPVDAAALSETLSRVALFAGRSNPPTPVRLSFTKAENLEGGELAVSARSAEIGEATEKIGMTVDTEFAAAFNGAYLRDGVKVCAGTAPSVVMKFNDPLKPAVLQPAPGQDPEGGPELTYLIMPMRDQDAEKQSAKPAA